MCEFTFDRESENKSGEIEGKIRQNPGSYATGFSQCGNFANIKNGSKT